MRQRTRRQDLCQQLREREWSFDELRHEFSLTVKVLEEDLRHIDRSVKAGGERLEIRTAECLACGFDFSKKALHPPGRCPSCRDRRIDGPWLRITS